MNFESAQRRISALFDRNDLPVFADPGARVALYGAGNCGRDALCVLRQAGYSVVGFIDVNAAKIGSVQGIPCYAPGSRPVLSLAENQVPVVMTVFNYTTDTGAIEISLRRDGFEHILPYQALYEKFSGALGSRFWLAPRPFWNEHQADIRRGLELWDDARSREIYGDLVELRLTGNFNLLRSPDRECSYFPKDLPPLHEPVRLIDGGAYTGDTLEAMKHLDFQAIAAFEPDKENFRLLGTWMKENMATLKEVILFPCGLGSETRTHRFQSGQTAGSSISKKGNTTVQVVALDDVLPRFAPNFIKLDIEGAEMDALKGALNTIRSFQPRIAACIYHSPAHLWEIPLQLKKILPDHRLSLRYHGFNGFDAVAYAIAP